MIIGSIIVTYFLSFDSYHLQLHSVVSSISELLCQWATPSHGSSVQMTNALGSVCSL